MKELYIAAHEECLQEYLDKHPNASWEEAYDMTAGDADDRMRDKLADMADNARTRAKEGL